MTVKVCMPIVVCMSRDFQMTYEEIGETFKCSKQTIWNKLNAIGYKAPNRNCGVNHGNQKHNKVEQEACYRRFIEYWDERGYSDKFEFLGGRTSSKGKVKLRCKLCGCEFERFGNIAQSNTNIRCTNCWIHRDDETIAPRDGKLLDRVADDYRSGMTTIAIQEKYNLQQQVVTRFLREAGVDTNPNRDCYIKRRQEENQWKHDAKANEKRIWSEFRAIEKDINGWRKSIEIFKDEKKRILKESNNLSDWITRKCTWHKSGLIDYEPQLATCKHCGKQWIFWPSRERYGRKKPPVYCSKSCFNKHSKKAYRKKHGVDNTGHRLRRHGLGAAPRDSIPLDEVIRRDNGICYICECKVDKEDSWRDDHGYFVCGPTYPTRDHVMPISKGGTHTWDNVRLACHRCNSLKGAKVQGAVHS